MNTKIKVFIVSLILLLSLGPIIFFFGSRPDIEIFPDNDIEPISLTFSGNVTGKIVHIDPFISYVGVSSNNDESYVKSLLSVVADNFTVSTTLNPYGEGYRYEITIFLENQSDTKKVGFRTYLRLSTFFADPGIPATIGKMELPLSFNLGPDVINTPENTTIPVALLYSQDIGVTITAYCPNIITSRNYNLTRVPTICTDTTHGHRHGLSITDLAAHSVEQAVEMDLTLESISSANFQLRLIL